VGQDLTKISLPVVLSEPLSSLQKCCDNTNNQEELASQAAQEPDSMKRLGLTIGHNISQFNMCKYRIKKPFNPHLGETFELVTEDFRFLAEQVSHHPPVSAYYQQGKNYTLSGFLDTKSTFGFGGGKGLMVVNTKGVQDYYYDKFEETISCNRPVINIRNLVLSTLYIDFAKDMYAVNHATGERAILNFVERGWTCDSYITGTMYDADGAAKYNITGSWMNKLVMTNIDTKEEFVIWEEPEQPKDAAR